MANFLSSPKIIPESFKLFKDIEFPVFSLVTARPPALAPAPLKNGLTAGSSSSRTSFFSSAQIELAFRKTKININIIFRKFYF